MTVQMSTKMDVSNIIAEDINRRRISIVAFLFVKNGEENKRLNKPAELSSDGFCS